VAINFTGEPYDTKEWPGNYWPACIALNQRYNDLYGRQQFVDKIMAGDYDLIFMIQDTFIVETVIESVKEAISTKVKQPPIIYYFPIDAPPKKTWAETVAKTDFPVAYTQYAKDEVAKWVKSLEHKCQVIHHGADPNALHFMDRDLSEFRREWFEGYANNKFLILNVNRNQSRKDIIRTFMILAELKRRGHTDLHLYMHMAQQDVGGDLNEMAQNFDLEFGEDWTCPANFNPHSGVSQDALNHIYNVADCLISTTTGEGFGLSILDGAITKTPMVLPANSCIPELMANNRAFLVPAGETSSNWVMKEMDNERLRPLMNVDKAADAIERIKSGDLPDVEGAYTWALEHNWDNIVKEWEVIFDAAQPRKVPGAAKNGKVADPEALMARLNRADRRRMEKEMRKKNKSVR
jgi:glycosyltransferase involved in cell wall biosynthesis